MGRASPCLTFQDMLMLVMGLLPCKLMWVTSEGSWTHEEEEGEIPSSGEGLGGSLAADTKLDGEPRTHKEEVGEFQSSGKRLVCPLVIVTKPDNRVLVANSDVHGTVVEAVLSANREPIHSLDVTNQTVDQGVGFLVAYTTFGARSTIVENSGCPILVESQLLVGSNLNIPVSEVGCGLIVSKVPRLIWDDPLSSDKGEEAINPVEDGSGVLNGRGFGAFRMGEKDDWRF
nr:hypothetical protein CFP56_57129 [Quercus suber]